MQVFTENFIRTRKIELFALISHKKQQKTCTVKLKCLPLHSLKKKHNGAIAQLVEQRTENPCVPGSIPGGTTYKESFFGVTLFCIYTCHSSVGRAKDWHCLLLVSAKLFYIEAIYHSKVSVREKIYLISQYCRNLHITSMLKTGRCTSESYICQPIYQASTILSVV